MIAGDRVAECGSRAVTRLCGGVVSGEAKRAARKPAHQLEGRRADRDRCAGLEGQTKNRDAARIPREDMALDQVVLRGVYLTHGARQRRIEIDGLRERHESVDVARQTSPTERTAGAQKAASDARIERERARNRVEIGAAEAIGQLSEKISERDFRAK